ncbi:hypothetical protein L1987_24335 [Smallanthus sonchifolius]|uniref:Uncharacterized protein n=1 Tax=Smallanthus sonchifolius TaxID=185202 RepID=A0ACB9ILX6_9ASTR|nr:hypothetical protein L1987_24335 [Smallanthus sonchifolius]
MLGARVEYKSNPKKTEQENEAQGNKVKNVEKQSFAVREGGEDMSSGTRGVPEGRPTILFLAVREEPRKTLRGVVVESSIDLSVYLISIRERPRGDLSFGYIVIVEETESFYRPSGQHDKTKLFDSVVKAKIPASGSP